MIRIGWLADWRCPPPPDCRTHPSCIRCLTTGATHQLLHGHDRIATECREGGLVGGADWMPSCASRVPLSCPVSASERRGRRASGVFFLAAPETEACLAHAAADVQLQLLCHGSYESLSGPGAIHAPPAGENVCWRGSTVTCSNASDAYSSGQSALDRRRGTSRAATGMVGEPDGARASILDIENHTTRCCHERHCVVHVRGCHMLPLLAPGYHRRGGNSEACLESSGLASPLARAGGHVISRTHEDVMRRGNSSGISSRAGTYLSYIPTVGDSKVPRQVGR